ncbi:MAG: IS4 family transposase [Betaproteobacteria bacterium]|nr:IS4 family transposase [Candidatus Dechloromonas phosphorivorans]
MFRISRMQEILKGLPRGAFDRLVSEHQADKYSKGFGCWDQLVAMLYGHLSGAESLRQLEAGFNSQSNHHYHLGTGPVRRSTLAEANGRRGAVVFEQAARLLMGQASRQLRRESQGLLYLLDSTSITLKGPGFDAWTQGNSTRHTQGIKLHLLYAAHEQIPLQHSFTAANVNDVSEGIKLPIERGATYVFDKGYCDYNWWANIDAQHARFVTRFKYNAALRVDTSRPIAAADRDTILEDQIVRFAYRHQGGGRRNRYEKPLRRIVVARPDKERPLILATNDLDTLASVIAQHYKDRWQIELFFKWIKQHLKIKRFLGRSENAVRIQILCALISYLLLALYKKAHAFTGSLWMLLATARASLFQRPSLEVARDQRRREQRLAFSQRQPGLFA